MNDQPEISCDMEELELAMQLVFQTKRRSEILAHVLRTDEEENRKYLEEFKPDVRELGKNIVVNLAVQGLVENDVLYGEEAIRTTVGASPGPECLTKLMGNLLFMRINYGRPENSMNHPQISFREDLIKLRTLAKFFERAGAMEDLQLRFLMTIAKDALFHLDEVPKQLLMLLDKDGRTEIEQCKEEMDSYEEMVKKILAQSGSNIFAARFKRKLKRGDIDSEILKKLTIREGTRGLALIMAGMVENTDELIALPEGFDPQNANVDYEVELKKFLKEHPNPKTVAARLLRTNPLA